MIKTLSPYYVNVPFVNPQTSAVCINYTLRIYVWNGSKTSVPTVPSYVMTKTNITNSGASDKVNIARLINDFIDFNPSKRNDTGLIEADNQTWCKTTIAYDGGTEQLATINLCLKGYSYGMGGENGQPPTNKVLMQGSEFKVNRQGVFNVPILINEPTVSVPFATITSVNVAVGNPAQVSVSWTYSRPYIPASINIQSSINNGATWTDYTNTSISPVNLNNPNQVAWFRLKSYYELETYSNIFVFTP